MKFLQKTLFISPKTPYMIVQVVNMMKFYFLLIFIITGCSKPLQLESTSIPLKEPLITTAPEQFVSTLGGKHQRTTLLNGLMRNIKESTFYINDYIDFETTEDSKNIQFHINTQCIESENQNKFTKDTTIPFKKKLYLIEMLPEEIFSYGNRWWLNNNVNSPSCSFHFKAINQTGSIHYFELPHLPIALFEHSWNLNLMDKENPIALGIENSKNFPVLLMEKMPNYQLVSLSSSEIDQLKLICDKGLAVKFDVGRQQQYDLWGLLGWSQLQMNSASSACRFLSLYKNHIVGVSQIFPLVPPVKENQFSIKQQSDRSSLGSFLSEEKASSRVPVRYYDQDRTYQGLHSDFFSLSPQLKGVYDDSLEFVITNKESEPLHLMIPDATIVLKSRMFLRGIRHTVIPDRNLLKDVNDVDFVPVGFLNYFISNMPHQISYFTMSQFLRNDQVTSRKIKDELENGSSVIHGLNGDKRYALLTVAPRSELTIGFGLVLRMPDLCHKEDTRNTELIGATFTGESLPVYQVLNNNDFEIASKTIVQQYNWNSDEFSWELWNNQLSPKQIDSYHQPFYKNTCESARNSYFAESTRKDRESWYLTFIENDYGKLEFLEKHLSQTSLDEAVDSILIQRKKEREEKRLSEIRNRKIWEHQQRLTRIPTIYHRL